MRVSPSTLTTVASIVMFLPQPGRGSRMIGAELGSFAPPSIRMGSGPVRQSARDSGHARHESPSQGWIVAWINLWMSPQARRTAKDRSQLRPTRSSSRSADLLARILTMPSRARLPRFCATKLPKIPDEEVIHPEYAPELSNCKCGRKNGRSMATRRGEPQCWLQVDPSGKPFTSRR
jgi:hypothetical protein